MDKANTKQSNDSKNPQPGVDWVSVYRKMSFALCNQSPLDLSKENLLSIDFLFINVESILNRKDGSSLRNPVKERS